MHPLADNTIYTLIHHLDHVECTASTLQHEYPQLHNINEFNAHFQKEHFNSSFPCLLHVIGFDTLVCLIDFLHPCI